MRWVMNLCVAAVIGGFAATGAVAENNVDATEEFSRGLAAMSRRDLDEAAKRFTAVLLLDPQSFEARNNLAVIYTEQGNYQAALIELRYVVEHHPEYYRGRKNLAELYVRLAYDTFIEAASVAPPDEKEKLDRRAQQIGAPPGAGAPGTNVGGVLEPASAAPAGVAAPASGKVDTATGPDAAPAGAAAATPAGADFAPAEFIVLASDAPGLGLSDAGMRLYRQIGVDVTPAERIAVKQTAKLPAKPVFYVAVPGDGRVDLLPLARGGPKLTIGDGRAGKADLVIEPQAFEVLQKAVQPYLSPAVTAATLRAANKKEVEERRLSVLEAFTRWSQSWQTKDLGGYLAAYTADYNPRGGPGAAQWREQRGKVFERSGDITIALSAPVILDGGDTLFTLTRQEYRSKLQSSIGVKKLTWTSTPEGWRITAEEMLSERIQKTPG